MSAAASASPAASRRSRLDEVRAVQHALYRTARADPGRRFHALWDEVLRRDVLWRGWVAARANNGAPGIDKTTLDQIEREYGVFLLVGELAAELREGRYRPLPARGVLIPKPGVTGEDAIERRAIFIGKRHKRGRRFGLNVVACQSVSYCGLISVSGIVVPPRASKPWRERPQAAGERRG
ncbi:MAG: hypothetical protein ACRDOK_26990 [Streptosporangiaceae bacterium]